MVARQCLMNNTHPTYVDQQIRERAYEIYLARGGQDGDEVSDWLAAEQEVNESIRPQKARAAARLALNVGLLM
jgi:hypothetical protein